MNFFEQLYMGIYKSCNSRGWKAANGVAVFQLTVFQIACLLGLGTLFAEFASHMNMTTMPSTKAWALFIITSILLWFINWMTYSGKKRNQLRIKSKKAWHSTYPNWLLWMLPGLTLVLSIILAIVLNP